jgi:transcriptional regulator with XRE-family HTH domain
MNKTRFGKFIEEKRGSKSRRILADILGISESYVVDIEIGKTVPAADKILLIANTLNVDSGNLFRLLDERFTNPEKPGELIRLPPDLNSQDREEIERFIRFKQWEKQAPLPRPFAGKPTAQDIQDTFAAQPTKEEMETSDRIVQDLKRVVNKNRRSREKETKT